MWNKRPWLFASICSYPEHCVAPWPMLGMPSSIPRSRFSTKLFLVSLAPPSRWSPSLSDSRKAVRVHSKVMSELSSTKLQGCTVRVSYTNQVFELRPNEKVVPGPPGWGFAKGLKSHDIVTETMICQLNLHILLRWWWQPGLQIEFSLEAYEVLFLDMMQICIASESG